MVQWCETSISHSLSFRRATLTVVLVSLCALSSSNYIHPVAECDNQDEDITALEQSSQVRNLLQLVETTLDERTLSAFPVQRDGHIERMNIFKEIWNNRSEEFGLELLGIDRLAAIDEIIDKNPASANVRIVLLWLDGKGRKPVTFGTLIDVLYEIGFNEIANRMVTTCEILKIMDVPYKPAKAKEFSQLLSGEYEKASVIDNMQWLPQRLRGRNLTFVDLELKEEGSNILLFDLLGDIQSGARILFVGRPGVGKTTITRHLSKARMHTERFYLVIKLHLGVTGKIDSLSTLLRAKADESFDPYDINIIANYINNTLGEGVCFLLDGFDEYRGDGSDYVTSLIHGNKLAKSVVIVTSRPSATEDIEDSFHRKVEIIGFGEKGMQTYLDQLQLSQAEYQNISQYLDTHPNIRQLCYLPLHLSMLVYIAVATKDSDTLSLVDTETELYTDFLFLTIAQYKSVRHERTGKSLKECFADISKETDLCILLRKICENAFEGVMSREQTFTSSSFDGLHVPDSINISAEIEALSFFKVETFYDRRGIKLEKYYYSHPTFQEFLAAFHLTTFPREEQLIYIKHFWMHEVYKFFLGLIGSELKYNETVSQTFVSFAREDLATYQHQELYVMKCAHEVGRGSQFITYLEAAGVITNSNSVRVYTYYNHDCWYVGYTLAQSPLYELIVDKHSELALCISFITNYLKHDPKILGSVNVTKLAFGDYAAGYWPWFTDREDPISTAEILEFLPALQDDLTHLELTFLKFEHSASVSRLGETLKPFRKLQFLALSVNISIIKEGHLESALKDLAHLEHLELGVINHYDDDTAVPDDLLEFRSLKQLRSLTLCISWNKDLVDVNMTALIGGLEYLTELKSLTIRISLYGGFRDNGATELFEGIEKVSSIDDLVLHLNLCEFGLGNVTTKELAAILRDLTVLKNLSLCIDFNLSGIQGLSGVIELAEGLKELTELQELSLVLRWELQANDAVDEAAIALADGLKHFHSLSALELNLKQNGSCSEIVSLFESLSQLQELKLGWNSPGGKTDAVKLINGLKHLKQLRKLSIPWNDIGDDDVVPLIESLKHMNHLHTLNLSHNKIGDAGIKLLAEVIESLHLSHLQVLLLNENKFSDVGAKILSEKVVKLSQLHTLDFGLTLGAYSAQALALIHQHNTIRNPIVSSNRSSDETYDFVYYYAPFITLGISALVGGFLCCIVFNSSPVLTSEASGSRVLPPKGISETLAQGIFSTSSAWKLERLKKQGLDGSGTVIVIFDTAIDLHCPAFLQKNIPVIDCLPQLPIAAIEHGSVCAAVAAGFSYSNTPSTIVPSGVAPGAQLIVYRVAEGDYCYNEAVLRALDDMMEKTERGMQIDVVSISYDFSEDDEEEIHRKIKALTEKGVVFVAAAGNRGRYQAHASIPACFDCVISVGALDRDGFQSRFNACGHIDVFAPGEDIPTPSSSSLFQGTSFATPAVSGLVSLLKQCANTVGPPASNYIHHVKILRAIFNRHMITRSDSGQVDVFDPVGFFLRVIDNPNLLNEITVEHLDTEDMEQ